MRNKGLHLRLATTLSDLLEKGLRIGMPIMQCFFVYQSTNKYLEASDEEAEKCKKLSKKYKALFLHASYWVNLAGAKRNGWRAFLREIEHAKKFGFTHIVIHPGSATGCLTRKEGIKCLANALNKAAEIQGDLIIVLENGAHAKMTVGGDLEDFRKLIPLLDHPEKIQYCIDTAHAHSYGYDVVTPQGQDKFLALVDEIIGKENVALLHLNETEQKRGSYIDQHAAFSDNGKIGIEAIKRFMNHPVCKDIPVILEIPVMKTEEKEKAVLTTVNGWDES